MSALADDLTAQARLFRAGGADVSARLLKEAADEIEALTKIADEATDALLGYDDDADQCAICHAIPSDCGCGFADLRKLLLARRDGAAK